VASATALDEKQASSPSERSSLCSNSSGVFRAVATLTTCCVAITLGAGCGDSSEGGYTPGPERSDEFIRDAVEEADENLDFPLLWLGRSYRGYRVNEIHAGGAGVGGVSYGDCEIPSDQFEGGCGLPYDLQEQDACDPFPIAPNADPRRRSDGTIVYSEGGGWVTITGRTYVKIFGEGARAAAQRLRPLGQDDPSGELEPAATCVPSIMRLRERGGTSPLQK
jgi:hypothetical protein